MESRQIVPARRPRRHVLAALVVLLVAASAALDLLSGCSHSPSDARLRGVPLPDSLRPAIEATRRSLAQGDGGDPAARLELERYNGLSAMFYDPERRAAAEDSLYTLWRGDLHDVVWPELASVYRVYIRDRARFDSLFTCPEISDTNSAIAAYVREWSPGGGTRDGSGYVRALAAPAEVTPFQAAWISIRRARALRSHGEPGAAATLALAVLPQARKLGGWLLEFEAWAQVQRALTATGDFDGALHAAVVVEDLARAVSRGARDSQLLLDARLDRAGVLDTRWDNDRALALYDSCTTEAIAAHRPSMAEVCLNRAAMITRAEGRDEQGLALSRRGLALAIDARDSVYVPRFLTNIAERHRLLGHLDSSRVYLAEAERWIRAFPDRGNIARFPLYQAEYFCAIGDYARVDSLEAVAERQIPLSAPPSLVAELHLQIIDKSVERGRPARAYRSIALLDSMRDRVASNYADRNEAVDLDLAAANFFGLQGQFRRASRALDRADSALTRRPDPRRRWNLLGARGHLARRRNDPVAAESSYRACLAMAERRGNPDPIGQSRVWLAALALEQGRFADVRALLPRESSDAPGLRRTPISARLIGAMADSRSGHFDLALREFDRVRKGLQPDSPPDLVARCDLETGRALAGLHRPEEARRAYERVKTLIAAERRALSASDPTFLDTDLRRELAEAILALAFEPANGSVGDRAAGDALREVESLLPAWSRAAGEETRLVEPQLVFFVGSNASYRWEIAGGHISLRRLPGETALLQALGPTLADLREPSRTLPARALDALTQALGGPVEGWPAGTELTIVPDGPLFSIPWPVLARGGAARGSWIDQGPIVLADTPVRFAIDSETSPDERRLLAVGVDTSPDVRAAGLSPLHHAEEEAREVCALWPKAHATLRVGPAADWGEITALGLAGFDAIHLSSHALVYRGLADQTTLVLAGARNRPVTAFEIGQLDLRADLVFLSCCEAAEVGQHYVGPAHEGLARSFLAAGAKNVVASAIRIEDASARQLAVRYYRHWLRGGSVAAALRAAQLDLRDGDTRWTHPYHWAFYQAIRRTTDRSVAASARPPSRRSE